MGLFNLLGDLFGLNSVEITEEEEIIYEEYEVYEEEEIYWESLELFEKLEARNRENEADFDRKFADPSHFFSVDLAHEAEADNETEVDRGDEGIDLEAVI